MDWVVILAICLAVVYLIFLEIFERKKPIKDAKKAAWVKNIIGLVWTVFLLGIHCYWQVQTWVIILLALCVVDAIFQIWCLTPFCKI